MTEEYYDEDGFRLLFEDDTNSDEKRYYMRAFPNVSKIAERKIHCTSCQTHIGTAPMALAIIRMHPVLRVTHCRACHAFYNSGEFDKGEDGSELYCRWCGQGGEVYCCSNCPYVFCKSCILKNLSKSCVQDIARNENWDCFGCAPQIMWHLRAQHWALVNFIEKQKKEIKTQPQLSAANIDSLLKRDLTTCCQGKSAHRWKGNQSSSTASGSKKHAKRAEVQDDADNVPLARLRSDNSGSGASDIPKNKSLEPMVIIPPISSPFLTKEKASSSAGTSTKVTEPKQQKKLKHKQTASISVETQQQSQSPPPKRTKKTNAEVVCTPDIMSMFNQMATEVQPSPSTSQASNASLMAASTPRNISDNPNAGPVPVSSLSQTPVPIFTSTPKPKAILHKSLGRNLTVRMGPIEVTPSTQANQVVESTVQSARGAPTAASKQANPQPMYHTFGGYRIDLISAAQQGTYRLPNGKFIQVRKQMTDSPASTAGSSNMVPEGAVRAPVVRYNAPNSIEQANRAALAHPQVNMQGLVVRAAPPQVFSSRLQQQSSSSTMSPTVQQTLSYIPQQTSQHQQQQQQQQPQSQPFMQQQLHQQALQRNQQPQFMQQQQLQQINQQLQQEIQQRQRIRTPMSPRGRQQKQQQPQQRQQPYTRIQPYPVPSRPVPGMPNTGPYPATSVAAQQQNQQQIMQQNPPNPPTATAQIHQPILHLLRSLVEAPHEDSPVGAARKDFEEKLLGCVEACNHIVVKIHSLTQSNSFKSIRNLRDLKELFIHLSYLITYGIGRFNSLHDRCVADVKKMGFTKPSDFVMMGEKVNNRNPEDSDDDDDCEIVEENTTVIHVDSDEEHGSGAGRAGPIITAADKRNAAGRVNPLRNSPMPTSTERAMPNATSKSQQSMPNDPNIYTSVEKRPVESIGSRKATTAEAAENNKSNKDSTTTSLEKDTMEGCTEPTQVRESATESGLEKDAVEGARPEDLPERNESLPQSEVEKRPESDQIPTEPGLEKETVAPVTQNEMAEPMESLETDEGTLEPNPKQNDVMEPMEVVEGTNPADLTERVEHSEDEKQPTTVNVETEISEPAEQNVVIAVLESSSTTLEEKTIEPAKKREIPGIDLVLLIDSEEDTQSLSDQSSTSASSVKETIEVVKENDLTMPGETLPAKKDDQTGKEAISEKETIDSAKEDNVIEPIESVETEGEDRTKVNHSNITNLEAGSKEQTAPQEERIEQMEVCEPEADDIVPMYIMFGSPTDEEKLDKLLSETLSDKNDDITLSSWGSIENIMARHARAESTPQKAQNSDGERGDENESIAPIANAGEKCTEDGNAKVVTGDAKRMESTSAACSSGKLPENEISNADAVQNAHPPASEKLHSDADEIDKGESHDTHLAVGLSDSLKQPWCNLSAMNDNQEVSIKQEADDVCDGKQLSKKDNNAENYTPVDVEMSVSKYRVFFQKNEEGELRVECSQPAATKNVDRTAQDSVPGNTTKQNEVQDSVPGNTTKHNESLDLFDDLSSISSSSIDEFVEATPQEETANKSIARNLKYRMEKK